MWVQEKVSDEAYSTPYKFTGKEYDAETGYYYYGARYYDPVVSRWVSADPALILYLPNGNKSKLPGMGGIYNPVNLNLYHYAGNNPVKFVDPNGMWQDKSQKISYDKQGVYHDAILNKGKVTKGDSLVKLAESQLIKERKTNKFTSADVQAKVSQIKHINDLTSSNIQIGRELVLGISNDKITGEKALVDQSSHIFILVGGVYGLYKVGAAGVSYAGGKILATDVGVKTSLYIGGITFAAKEGIKNRTLILNAISRIPQLGNTILKFGPEINSTGRGLIQSLTPGPPSINDVWEGIGWGAGTFISGDN